MAPSPDSRILQIHAAAACYLGYAKESCSGTAIGSSEGQQGKGDPGATFEEFIFGFPGTDSGSAGGSGVGVSDLPDGTCGDPCGGSGGPVQDDEVKPPTEGYYKTVKIGMGSHHLYQNPHDIQIVPGDEVELDDDVIISNLTTGEQAPWPIYTKPSLDMAIPVSDTPDLNGDTFSPEAIEQGASLKEQLASLSAPYVNGMSIGALEIRTAPTPLEITPEQTPLVLAPDPPDTNEPVIPRCECGAQYRLNDIQTHRGRLFVYLRCGLCNRKRRMEFRPMGDGLVGNQYDEVELVFLKRKRLQ